MSSKSNRLIPAVLIVTINILILEVNWSQELTKLTLNHPLNIWDLTTSSFVLPNSIVDTFYHYHYHKECLIQSNYFRATAGAGVNTSVLALCRALFFLYFLLTHHLLKFQPRYSYDVTWGRDSSPQFLAYLMNTLFFLCHLDSDAKEMESSPNKHVVG